MLLSSNRKPAQTRAAVLEGSERWYVAHTLPTAELRAQGHLEYQGFRTFLPKRGKTVQHARASRTIEAPFFHRYLFVVLDLTQDPWRRVNGTAGVSRLVMQGEQPQPVPPGIVEALVSSSDSQGILQLRHYLRVGEPVRVMAGAFADRLAILDELDDSGRVRVLLDILGRKVSVYTDSNNLLPISPVHCPRRISHKTQIQRR
jgi:transcription elongation factor/antiterminator RfaH